jgi:phosphate-selective porin OprO/OprP
MAPGTSARGQAPAGPTQELFGPTPPVPSAVAPPSEIPALAPPTPREAQLEDRVRQLEAMVQQLSNQINQAVVAPGPAAPPAVPGAATRPGTAAPDIGTPAEVAAPSATGGVGAPGQSLPPNPPPSNRFNSPATLDRKTANVIFGPGFEIRTNDDEYIFQFHNLTQLEYRGYLQGGQNPVHDTFDIPRQWWMFSGRITKPWGYFVSFAHGFDAISILDVFVDADYDPRFRIRMGRFKTPFTYEFLVDPPQSLIQPEQSIFFNNFGQNRDIGFMPFGRLFGERFDYAVGMFNGSRNGVVAAKDAKAISAFINYRPFGAWKDSALENFNIGGSMFACNEDNPPVPQTLRTIVPTNGNAVLGVPFLSFNPNVIESGPMAFWDLHTAYYYKGLALIAEWASGTQRYALNNTPRVRTAVPVQSFYVQMGYLLTGETRSTIGIVKPNHPFSLKKGNIGWGAWELTARYSYLDIGQQVFTSGLADPNLWANRLNVIDLGVNWHATQYVKVYLDWEHTEFNQPVQFAPGREQLNSDMFIARFQLYF